MRVRLALEGDTDALLSLAEMQVAETLEHLPFDREMAAETLRRILRGDGEILWVAENGREIVGFLWATLNGYSFCTGVFVSQEVVYVCPDKRGTRAAVQLLREYISWGRIVGATEILFGISNGKHPERAARLFAHLGAEQVGYHFRIIRGPGRDG